MRAIHFSHQRKHRLSPAGGPKRRFTFYRWEPDLAQANWVGRIISSTSWRLHIRISSAFGPWVANGHICRVRFFFGWGGGGGRRGNQTGQSPGFARKVTPGEGPGTLNLELMG